MPAAQSMPGMTTIQYDFSTLPFNDQTLVSDFILCRPDVEKPDKLSPCNVQITDQFSFVDRVLPPTDRNLSENKSFPPAYFVALHNEVKAYVVHNYRGARIPLPHNSINVERFREYLTMFDYPHIQIMQFIEFGFPLGLWSDSFLVPNDKNHSSDGLQLLVSSVMNISHDSITYHRCFIVQIMILFIIQHILFPKIKQ